MKIAVFSDVHGNLEALEKVLGQIRKQNADKTIFLGDIFQRGNHIIPDPVGIRNARVLSDKNTAIDTAAEMFGKMSLKFGIDMSEFFLRINNKLKHKTSYASCGKGIYLSYMQKALEYIR